MQEAMNPICPDAEHGDGQGRLASAGIVATAVGLMGIGAVMSFSTSASLDHPILGWPPWHYAGVRQCVFLAGGLVALLVGTLIPYHFWASGRGRTALILLVISLVGCGMVLMPGVGHTANQARRWIALGPESMGLRLQPSEFLKLTLIVFLAFWISRRGDVRRFWKGFVPAVLVVGVSVGVVGIEDFGTAVLLAFVGGGMLVIGGARWWQMGLLVLPAVPAFFYLLMSRSHRLERLMIFRDIWKEPTGKGYQVIESLCSICNGGLWGQGLGSGFVKGYLPAARTDFVFAVICEELGIVGGIAVIGLLGVLVFQGWRVYSRCQDPFGRMLAFGMTLVVGVQAAINIAVVTVTVPTKGIALPLISSGGSGVLCMGALIGVLASIPRTVPRTR